VGEISAACSVDIPKIARDTVLDIGYDRAEYGLDGSACGVLVSIDEQSPDIARGIDVPWEHMERGGILKHS
jgi:S-adenosylmethionine synthetase